MGRFGSLKCKQRDLAWLDVRNDHEVFFTDFPFLYTAAHGFQRVFKKLLQIENKGTDRRNEGVEYVNVYETWVIFSLGRKAMWFPNIVSSGSLKSI